MRTTKKNTTLETFLQSMFFFYKRYSYVDL